MTKTKKEPSYNAKYVPLILWWDDVTEIFEILSAGAQSVVLETKQYKFSSLEAAKEHFGDTPQFDVKITSSNPYATVAEERLTVGAGQSSAELFMEIDRILRKRQRRPGWIYANWVIVPILAVGLVQLTPLDQVTKACATGLQLFTVLIYVRSTFISIKRGLVVYPKRKSEARGFFQRNKDQLLMFIITGVVGALVGFGISQVKDHYFPAVATTAPAKP